MERAFRLDLLTPDKVFFSGDAEILIVPAQGGEMGILADHEPIIVALSIGTAKIKVKGAWREAALAGGVLVVTKEKSTVLTDSAEWPEDIDAARAEAARKRSEEKLAQSLSKEEYAITQAALLRAIERLKLSKTKVGPGVL